MHFFPLPTQCYYLVYAILILVLGSSVEENLI